MEPKSPENIQGKTMPRRKVIGGIAGGLSTMLIGGDTILSRFKHQSTSIPQPRTKLQPTATEAPPPSPIVSPTPTETTHEETPKSIEEQLVEIYGDGMGSDDYPRPEDKIAFMHELGNVATRLNPDNPNLVRQLAAAIHYESDGTFSPSIRNKTSDATGLIQFINSTAESMGYSLEDLASMNPLEQLKVAEIYLKDRIRESGVPFENICDIYTSILWPAGMGKSVDSPLFSRYSIDKYARLSYVQNPGFDFDFDGTVTVGEAAESVITGALSKGEKITNLLSPDEAQKMEPIIQKAKVYRAFREQLRIIKPDTTTLNAISDANTALMRENPNTTSERRTLSYVTNTLEHVYGTNNLIEALRDVPSAYQASDVFRTHQDMFAEVQIPHAKFLEILPIGSIIVFNPEPSDDPNRKNGRIVIVKPNRDDGTCINGSDRETTLEQDLSEMQSGYSVFVPIKKAE